MHNTAMNYLRAGLCVLPADRKSKYTTIGKWKHFQDRRPTEAELEAWLANNPDGLCIVTGQSSGNLEVMDFDGGGELYDDWRKGVLEAAPELPARLVIEHSPSGGYHVFYRSEAEVSGNLKLAQRLQGKKHVTLIETRGQGGLIVCAPTAGYELIQGQLEQVPTITRSEREILLQSAWAFNEFVPRDRRVSVPAYSSADTTRPGDDFNAKGDIRPLLEAHGWAFVRRQGDNELWRRPGKSRGTSATFNGEYFYVFSSNAHPFESERAYTPFAVYARLVHDEDYEAAARQLRIEGYGATVTPKKAVELSGLLGDEDEDPPADILPDPGPIPVEMLRVPGFISDVMDLTLSSAPYPNTGLAFCGALALQSFLCARKVRDYMDNRSNIHLLALASSGSGKDHPRKVNVKILSKVGFGMCIGNKFASGEGLQDALQQHRAMLFQNDEIDDMLLSISRARDARFESIMSTLLMFYSHSNQPFHVRKKAGRAEQTEIDQPSLTLFGTACPGHYYSALNERMLTNGFFARMIVVDVGKRGEGQDAGLIEVPENILEIARYWRDLPCRPGCGNLSDEHPEPRVIEYTPDARGAINRLRRDTEFEYRATEESGNEMAMTVWGRVAENARKLALLHSCSIDHENPIVTVEAVEWAGVFAMHMARRMLYLTGDYVARNDFDATCKELVRYLRRWHETKCDNTLMPAWELKRRLKIRPREFDDVIEELNDQKMIVFETRPGKTKAKSGYRLLSTLEKATQTPQPQRKSCGN